MDADVYEHFRTWPHDVEGLLDRFWTAYGRAVFAFLVSRLRDRDKAADICQETFARALEHMRSHPPPAADRVNFRGWLLTIAHNLVIGQGRRRSLVQTWSTLGVDDDPYATLADANAIDPADTASQRALVAIMRECLQTLPEAWRRALVMVELEETPHAEAASTFGWKPGMLRVTLHRGRSRLRECIEQRHATAASGGASHG